MYVKYKLERKEGLLTFEGGVSHRISSILKGLLDQDRSVPGGLPEDREAEVTIGKAMDHLVLIEN